MLSARDKGKGKVTKLGRVERCWVHVQDSGSARDKGKGTVTNLGRFERCWVHVQGLGGARDKGKGRVMNLGRVERHQRVSLQASLPGLKRCSHGCSCPVTCESGPTHYD